MQHIDNNLDDLFRRAAADYSLREGRDDWDRIVQQVMDVASPAVPLQKGRQVKKYSTVLLFSFLLIFVAGIATTDIYYSGSKKTDKRIPANEKLADIRAGNGNAYHHWGETVQRASSIKKGLNRQHSNASGHLLLLNMNTDIPGGKNGITQAVTVGMALNERVAGGQQSKTEENTASAVMAGSKAGLVDTVAGEVGEKQAIPRRLAKKNDTVIDSEMSKIAVQHTVEKNKPAVYWGGVFGPSFNQVKSQGLRKPGYDIGLLAGLQFSKRLSIETGVLYEKKYYFSDGKYFDIAKASSGMPAGMKVVSLEGSCSIIEIPFKVKYNLRSRGDKHFYTTAGISGYIVTGEYNKYHAILNGAEQDITGSYNKSSGYTAAVLVLGAGYENSMGKSLRIRIAPYVQIPLRGIGVGALPVMTTGLHFGFTRVMK